MVKYNLDYEKLFTNMWNRLISIDMAPSIFPPNFKVKKKPDPNKNSEESAIAINMFIFREDFNTKEFMPYMYEIILFHEAFEDEVHSIFRDNISFSAVLMYASYIMLHEMFHYIHIYRNWEHVHSDTPEDTRPYDEQFEEAVNRHNDYYSSDADERETNACAITALRTIFEIDSLELYPKRKGDFMKYVKHRNIDQYQFYLMLHYIELAHMTQYCKRDITPNEFDRIVDEKVRTIRELQIVNLSDLNERDITSEWQYVVPEYYWSL